MPDKNKVRFGLKNVHYALLTESDSAAPTFGTVKALPGAVSMELTPEGGSNPFYADNIEYFRNQYNNGYSGSLELAKVPDEALQDIWGYGYDNTNKLIYEDAKSEGKYFALLFQIEGDKHNDCYTLYKCYASRPNIGSTTIGENGPEPQTQSVDLTAIPLVDPTGGILNNKVKIHTDENTSDTIKNAWFTQVFTSITATI